MEFEFENFEAVGPYFKKVINYLKQMNYSQFQSEDFEKNKKSLAGLLKERQKVALQDA